MITVNQASTLN